MHTHAEATDKKSEGHGELLVTPMGSLLFGMLDVYKCFVSGYISPLHGHDSLSGFAMTLCGEEIGSESDKVAASSSLCDIVQCAGLLVAFHLSGIAHASQQLNIHCKQMAAMARTRSKAPAF